MAEQNRMDELFLEFTDAQWERLTLDERQAALQEMEILIAEEQGRRPMPVVLFEPKDENEDKMLGYFYGDAIHMNANRLRSSGKYIPGVISGRGMQALNTLLHEGRHAWQWEVACNRVDGVASDQCTMIRSNFSTYCSFKESTALYSCQPIELDARRFAKEHFEAMARRARENGCDDWCIEKQLEDNITAEEFWASTVRRELTIHDMEEFEKKALAKMREQEPETDLSGISLFREAIEMMESDTGFTRYIEGKPLFWKEQNIGEIVASFDAKPDAAEDGLDPELRGLLDRLHAPDEATDAVRERPDRLHLGMC